MLSLLLGRRLEAAVLPRPEVVLGRAPTCAPPWPAGAVGRPRGEEAIARSREEEAVARRQGVAAPSLHSISSLLIFR